MSEEAALLEEISRLSGAIQRRQTTDPPPPQQRPPPRFTQRGPPHKPLHYRPRTAFTDYTPVTRPGPPQSKQEIVIDGVKFESNGKTLVRMQAAPPQMKAGGVTLAQPSNNPPVAAAEKVLTPRDSPVVPIISGASRPLIRTRNGLVAADRYIKPHPKPPKSSRSRYRPVINSFSTRAPPGRNLTLNKTTRINKPRKLEKQCKHFTRTGMCARGMTCKYQHDPAKIALCPLFLLEKCPNSADTCSLSHESTPERTPLCIRFNSTGECYKGSRCLYPHIRVGPKTGICRDFAVCGYCEKGAMCEASHLKECPDFAEKGTCLKMNIKGANGCHLPHVIRANQGRVKTTTSLVSADQSIAASKQAVSLAALGAWEDPGTSQASNAPPAAEKPTSTAGVAPDIGVGGDANEFISLTFEESDDEEDDEEEEDEDEEDSDEDSDAAEVDAVDSAV